MVWGDYQCDTAADPVDSLVGLRFDASLGVNLNGCPPLGTTVDILTNAAVVAAGAEVPWGDVDCDAALNPVDSLKILRHDAALEVEQEEDCALIGSEVMIRVYALALLWTLGPLVSKHGYQVRRFPSARSGLG